MTENSQFSKYCSSPSPFVVPDDMSEPKQPLIKDVRNNPSLEEILEMYHEHVLKQDERTYIIKNVKRLRETDEEKESN